MGYDWSYEAEEGPTDFTLMAFSSLGSSSSDTKTNWEWCTIKSKCFPKSQSPVRRTFQQRTSPKTSDLKETVSNVKVNNVTTAGTKAVVSTTQRNGKNAVKSSACWIWRPTGKGNPQYTLKDQGIFDSRCSRHMTGNKSFLADYQEIDGEFVAFGVTTGNQTNNDACLEKNDNASSDDKDAGEVPNNDEGLRKGNKVDDHEKTDCSCKDVNIVEPSINTASTNINISSLNINVVGPIDPNMPSLEDTGIFDDADNDTGIFDDAYDDRDVGAEADTNNLVFQLLIEAIRIFLAYASFMGFIVYQIDVKSAFLYGTIEEEVYVCQPLGFEDPHFLTKFKRFRRGIIDKTLFIKKDRDDILLVQVCVDNIIFGSTKKSLCDEFEKTLHKRFQMNSIRELTFFLGLQVKQKEDGIFISQDKYVADILKKFEFTTIKTSSTPMKPNKSLVKDAEAEDVPSYSKDFTSSCCEENLQILKRGKLMLLSINLQLLVMVSAVGIIDFLNVNPIKYALTVIPTIYSSRIKQFWTSAKVKTVNDDVWLQALVDGKKVIMNEASIRRDLRLDDAEAPVKVDEIPTDTQDIPSPTQPSSSQPQRKHKPRRKQRKVIEVTHTESQVEEHIPTPSHDPLTSGEDRLKLFELMEICIKLSDRVLSLEHTKTNQAAEIKKLKKRVKKLKGRQKRELMRRINDQDMFGVHDLEGDEVFVEVTTGENVEQDEIVAESVKGIAAAITPQITKDELTLAQTLMEIKATKPKAKWVTIQEPSKFRTTSPSKPPHAKDKGKRIIVEPEKPLKKKDQIAMDEEITRKLEDKMKAKMEKEERIAKERDRERERDEANRTVIEESDDVQAIINKDFKGKRFDDIKKIFDKVYNRVNTFVDMSTENVEESLKKTQAEVTKGSSKRAREELEQESAKKQKLVEQVQDEVDDTSELKKCLETVPEDEDDVAIKATPLSSKSPTIVDYKNYREWKKSYFKIIRADGNS
uniref:Retrovirus-related Pol polyprotein from transposon TNT 1-94 n=1 Tax=Tanacetum cinerariifolium TaxID=118510 RepID=A0A6L2MVW5_TANCI|nr:retrovirus-related Pol polyprotein from transposon TNT 1-94 [Tanacetum cinerariifolium]